MQKTTKTIRSKGVAYRAIVTFVDGDGDAFTGDVDVVAERSTTNGQWTPVAFGMFGAGGLDFGDDWMKIPEAVHDRLHDVVESTVQALINEESDSEEDDEED